MFSMAAYVSSAKTGGIMISTPTLLNCIPDNVRLFCEIAEVNVSSVIKAYSTSVQAIVKISLMIVTVIDTLQMTTWSSFCKSMIMLSL